MTRRTLKHIGKGEPPSVPRHIRDGWCSIADVRIAPISKGEERANIYYTMPPWVGSGLLRRGCGGRGRSAASVARCFLRLTCKASDCVGDAAKTAPRSIVSI